MSQAGKKFSVGVFHAAYGLRGEESEGDFRFVEDLACAHGVPFFARRVTADERAARHGESVQAWARRLRRESLAAHARDGWAIAMGHHLDDLAETVLMRLARGAAPRHLAGMRDWRAPYWRPLLGVRRAELAAHAASRGLAHREDSSNARLDYARNVLRHKVLPELEGLFPGAAERLVATALEARGDGELERQRDALGEYLREASPNAPLSRAFLDAAVESHKADVPGTGGEWQLVRVEPGLKAKRAAQHRRGLRALSRNVALEPGAYATFRHGVPE